MKNHIQNYVEIYSLNKKDEKKLRIAEKKLIEEFEKNVAYLGLDLNYNLFD